MTPCRSRRRGVTLAELMVAILVSAGVLTVVWRIFISEQRRFFVDQDRLSGIQGVLLLQESLETDLSRLALITPAPGRDRYTIDDPLQIRDSGHELSFLVHDEPVPGSVTSTLEKVTYTFDETTAQVVRQEGSSTAPLRGLRAEEITFLDPEIGLRVPTGVDASDLPVDAGGMRVLKYRVTGFPESTSENLAETRPSRVTLVGLVAIQTRQRWRQVPFWAGAASEDVDPDTLDRLVRD